jgi:hypothetical protein
MERLSFFVILMMRNIKNAKGHGRWIVNEAEAKSD